MGMWAAGHVPALGGPASGCVATRVKRAGSRRGWPIIWLSGRRSDGRRAVVRQAELRELFQHLEERLNLTEVSLMSRIMKVLCLGTMASVYLMQAPCTTKHGVTILPNIGGMFSGLTSSLGGLI